MTYIEFFDKYAVENIGASLSNPPERVIFVGDNRKKMERFAERCRKLFEAREYEIEFICKSVPRCQLDKSVEVLTEIVNEYDDCVFDVTGGSEILNLALGVVFAQNPEKNIQIHQINFRNNTIQDCDKDGRTVFRKIPKLSVQENVLIHGGDILYGAVDEENTYDWELTSEFCDDLLAIWNICKANPHDWNAQLSVFDAMETVGEKSEDGLTTTADYQKLLQELTRRNLKYEEDKKILKELQRYGLVTYFSNHEGYVTATYKDKQVKRTLTKAGQALEMRVFLAALESVDEDENYIYDDVMNGVVIDWDGEETGSDTKNEIDVVMMHGVIPVFVSCKNGFFTSDELYKLATVAERFGGKYAKKVLVASTLDTLPSEKYLRQRAEDMGIRIIDDVRRLTTEQLAAELRKCW